MENRVDKVRRFSLRAGFLAGAAAALIAGQALFAGQALAADNGPRTPCFFVTQWQGGWKAPNENTIYIGINTHDVYRIDLSGGSPQLMWPNMHLISEVRGSSSICSAIDLQLSVADTNGFKTPLIAKQLTKLTPEEIAQIPKKYRPN